MGEQGIIIGINKRNKAWNEYNNIPNYLNQNKYKCSVTRSLI